VSRGMVPGLMTQGVDADVCTASGARPRQQRRTAQPALKEYRYLELMMGVVMVYTGTAQMLRSPSLLSACAVERCVFWALPTRKGKCESTNLIVSM